MTDDRTRKVSRVELGMFALVMLVALPFLPIMGLLWCIGYVTEKALARWGN